MNQYNSHCLPLRLRRIVMIIEITGAMLIFCHRQCSAKINMFNLNRTSYGYYEMIEEPKWSLDDQRLLVRAIDKRNDREYLFVLERTRIGFKVRNRISIPMKTQDVYWVGNTNKVLLSTVNGNNKFNRNEVFYLKYPNTHRLIIPNGFYPHINRNGTKMIYDSLNHRIWVYDLVNHKNSRITGESTIEWAGEWSPDGACYAFIMMNRLFIIEFNQIIPYSRILVRNLMGFVNMGNGWTDNKHIIFGDYDGKTKGFTIYSVAVNGGRIKVVIPPGLAPPPYGEAMWLDNGKVGYPVVDKGDRYVIVDVRTKHIHDITIKGGSDIASYSFSHNAMYLAVINLHQNALLIVNCKSGHIVRLTFSTSPASSPGKGGKH